MNVSRESMKPRSELASQPATPAAEPSTAAGGHLNELPQASSSGGRTQRQPYLSRAAKVMESAGHSWNETGRQTRPNRDDEATAKSVTAGETAPFNPTLRQCDTCGESYMPSRWESHASRCIACCIRVRVAEWNELHPRGSMSHDEVGL